MHFLSMSLCIINSIKFQTEQFYYILFSLFWITPVFLRTYSWLWQGLEDHMWCLELNLGLLHAILVTCLWYNLSGSSFKKKYVSVVYIYIIIYIYSLRPLYLVICQWTFRLFPLHTSGLVYFSLPAGGAVALVLDFFVSIYMAMMGRRW